MKKSFSESFLHRKYASSPDLSTTTPQRKPSSVSNEYPKSPTDFVKLKLLGKGDVGRVYLVKDVSNQNASNIFAMKILSKTEMIARNKIHRVLTEQRLMIQTTHPFIVSLKSTFQSPSHLYLCLEYCAGGELFKYMQSRPNKRLPEPDARFYISEVVSALEYLHLLGYIYRDLKPENILIHESGHVKLADFDLCKATEINSNPHIIKNTLLARHFMDQIDTKSSASVRSHSFVGTEEYMSPEIIKGKEHSSSVDWWTVGILLFEMLMSKTPFKGTSQKETFRNIVHMNPDLSSLPSAAVKSLVKKLLVKSSNKRLGSKYGAIEVKTHSFFKGVCWSLLLEQKPPMIPSLKNKYDTKYFREYTREDFGDEIPWAANETDDHSSDGEVKEKKPCLPKSSSMTALRLVSNSKAKSNLRTVVSADSDVSDGDGEDITNSGDLDHSDPNDIDDPFVDFETIVKK